MNLNDWEINEKYFNSDFDLRNSIKLIVGKYFPNIGYRWLSNDHYCHIYVIKIFLTLFEYGLWRYEDIDWVLSTFYWISEIMRSLEDKIENDC